MRKNYTAFYLPNPFDETKTASKFTTIKAAELYIRLSGLISHTARDNWLVIDTEDLARHLTDYEQKIIEAELRCGIN